MTAPYTHLAQFYDGLMETDYAQWEEYILSLFKRHNCNAGSLLDLGCGTGNLTLPLARSGYALTAVDVSAKMLEQAMAKAGPQDPAVLFLQQDLRQLSLAKSDYDAAISTCDVINYFTSHKELKAVFQGALRHLAPGSLFLFDLNSAFKLENIYGNQSYADLLEDFSYFWDNSYDPKSRICEMELTFFVRLENGLYKKIRERHRQKAWLPREIKEIAGQVGFSFLACYDFLTFLPCSQESQRWQFVLQV